ncbi:probable ADP-ribosylation factor GTPase-activating protein AGD14 [Cornus florida]|uniref:probable ADP-ribosylation factor GTPase-activating protein AGD14 n=1 Tax=Cornus florida TaxID=4283 RepID=UPI0028A00D8A|nr:probable ADP-ribosylation factor GTPase-activating protein AGD14 [Cornus florida]
MTNRMKEEERIEKIIRGLLKLPENRRCINCNSLGPQYVCTTFWTFVCTNCSGAHREFAHRVKSVSMAKFNAEELSALQAGGNEKARQIYLKVWDPQLHSFPDGSNLQKLRDFIKHVYVGRKFTGERSADKLPTVKVGAKEDFYERYNPGGRKDERNLKNYIDERRSPHYKQENDAKEDFHEQRSIERYSPGRWKDDRNLKCYNDGRRSPHYKQENCTEDYCERRPIERHSPGGRKEDRNSKYYSDERRIPPYKQENIRSGGRRSRPVNFEIVDDRVRDDRRRSEIRRNSAESKSGSRSPDSQKSREMTGPPVVRSVKDILGENVPPLRVGEHPEVNDKRDTDGSAHDEKSESSSTPAPVDEKLVEHKRVNSESLIDFSTDLEPCDTIAAPQTEQTAPPVDGGNLVLVQSSPKEKSSDVPNLNSVESLLFDLSPPSIEPVGVISDAPGSGDAPSATPVASSNSVSAPAASPVGMAVPWPSSGSDSMVEVTAGQQLPTMQQHLPSSTSPVGTLYNQPWTASQAPSSQGPSSATAEQLYEAASKTAQDTSFGVGPQAVQMSEAKSTGRKELPADLFCGNYSSYHAPVSSWQTHPPHGMGFGMQYHPTATPVSTFPNSAKSKNPFDISDDTTQDQAPMFPSMSPLQGALPMASPYASALPPQSPSNGMPPIPNAFMGQHLPNNMPSFRPQVSGSFDGSQAAFASLNPIQQPGGGYPTPTTSSSMGGNPFG